MRISDWSSDVCSSDLKQVIPRGDATHVPPEEGITKEQLKAMLFIHPEECIDCGACESVCPVTAIFPEANTPEQWKDYIKLNRSEERRVGKEGVSRCRSRWSPYH